MVGGVAGASPQPTLAQVQHRLNSLNNEADRVGQQFDQVQQELTAANQRLALVNREEARYRARFESMRSQIGSIAATAYEDGTLNSSAALLTSGNPQQILNQSSILTELSSANRAAMQQFVSAARELTSAQQSAKRTEQGIAQLKAGLTKRKQSLSKLIGQEKTLVAQLTPAQRQTALPGGGGTGTGGGTSTQKPPAPPKGATGQAAQAVAYAFAHIGDPYVWGATGPSSFDCSGLMMAAWASAGVSIARVSYAQMSSLPSVPLNDLQPGDILGFAGNSHVGMYVGHNELIDAPQTGEDVEEVPLSGWYAQELDGAVQP
ncbi:MAG: NlpC/P60 family protein [Streptosporangiaceae bacterium]|jgi:cell wall-associated NlpC family hydrolase